MILKTSIDKKEKEIEIEKIVGKSYGLYEKISLGIYGSPKYKIIDIYPENVGFKKNNDIISCNFEIKKRGLAMYFRIINEEYALVGRFNQVTFQTSEYNFELQINGIAVKTEIMNQKEHMIFLKTYSKYRTFSGNPGHQN
tara:strand:- start:571 stop:990 length:420 start_codon:yes stop_codon:yes gene_type:complete